MSVSVTAGTPDDAHVVEGDSGAAEIHMYTNVGFTSVEWYVNDTLVATHTGDGTGTYDSLSGYDFAGFGSTTGNFVTVKAVAKRKIADIDEQAEGYAYVTVWTSPQDAISPSISFGDDMEPGGSFAFEITLSAPNAHYQIDSDSVVVEVEGSEPGFWQRIGESTIGSAIVSAGGWIGKNVGKKVVVKVTTKVILVSTGAGAIVGLVVEEGVRYTYNHFVRSTLTGWLNCASDLYPLGTLAQGLAKGGTFPASASVRYKEVDGKDTDTINTESSGRFAFDDVPCGKALEVTGIRAQNYHNHNQKGSRVVIYGKSSTYLVAPIGTRGSWVPVFGGYSKGSERDIGSILMPPKLNF